jgi:hypothetical protein
LFSLASIHTKTVQNVVDHNHVDSDWLDPEPFDPANSAQSQFECHAKFVVLQCCQLHLKFGDVCHSHCYVYFQVGIFEKEQQIYLFLLFSNDYKEAFRKLLFDIGICQQHQMSTEMLRKTAIKNKN